MHRYGDPLRAAWRFDLVAVTPVSLSVLQIIVKDEQVHFANEIEISTPGHKIRLYDANFHGLSRGAAYHVSMLASRALEHARQVLTNNAQREQLHAAENDDSGGQEREAGDGTCSEIDRQHID